MKKLTLLILTALFIFFSAKTQLEMNSNGEVGIGTSPVSGVKLSTPVAKMGSQLVVGSGSTGGGIEFKVGGESLFTGTYATTSSLKFESEQYYSSYFTRMVPTQNNVSDLGQSNYAFDDVYLYYFCEISDKRQKENIQNITGALNTVMKLKGIRYFFH